MNSRTLRGGLVLTAAATFLAAIGPAGLPVEGAAPEVSGVVIRYGQSSNNFNTVKSLDVQCLPDEKAVGGGASVHDTHDGITSTRATLTRSAPTAFGWAVTAVTIPFTVGDWYIVARAVCVKADSVDGLRIVSDVAEWSSSSAPKTTEAHCSSGQRALGSGAMIRVPPGSPDAAQRGLGLQVMRASGDGRLTRAQARETAAGNQYDWSLVGFAICADTPAGYVVRGNVSYQAGSEMSKHASSWCDVGEEALGPGAAVTNAAPANVMLNALEILPGWRMVRTVAVETTPTNDDWDFIVAQAICVN